MSGLLQRVEGLERWTSTRRFCVQCAVTALEGAPGACGHQPEHNRGLPLPRGFSAAEALVLEGSGLSAGCAPSLGG
jgi:hypothetical protein